MTWKENESSWLPPGSFHWRTGKVAASTYWISRWDLLSSRCSKRIILLCGMIRFRPASDVIDSSSHGQREVDNVKVFKPWVIDSWIRALSLPSMARPWDGSQENLSNASFNNREVDRNSEFQGLTSDSVPKGMELRDGVSDRFCALSDLD